MHEVSTEWCTPGSLSACRYAGQMSKAPFKQPQLGNTATPNNSDQMAFVSHQSVLMLKGSCHMLQCTETKCQVMLKPVVPARAVLCTLAPNNLR